MKSKKNRAWTRAQPYLFTSRFSYAAELVAIIFVIIGLIWSVLHIGYIWNGIASSSWPNTQGTVIHTKIKRVTSGGGVRTGSSVSFKPVIDYSYFVAQEEYFGNCYAFGMLNYKSVDDAQKIIDSFPVNSKTTVYYSQMAPQKSVLKPGLTGGAIYKLCFSIAFVLVGIILFVLKKLKFLS